jgi:hypothetical protein
MTVYVNLGQKLALRRLIHDRQYAWESSRANATVSKLASLGAVVAYTNTGERYEWAFNGAVKLDGKVIEHIVLGTTFIPVIPKWFGSDMDEIWQDMPVHEAFNWEADGFETTPMVSAVLRIINGGW